MHIGDDDDLLAGIPQDDELLGGGDDDDDRLGELVAEGIDDDPDDDNRIKLTEDDQNDEPLSDDDKAELALQEIVFDDETGDEIKDGDPEQDDDFEEPQNSVEKRIQRERRLKAEANTETQRAEQHISAVTQFAQRQERELLETKKNSAQITHNVLKTNEELLLESMKTARENGDDELASKREAQLLEVRDGLRVSEDIYKRNDTDLNNQARKSAVPGYQARSPLPPKSRDWIDNNPWFSDGKHEVEAAAAHAIDKQLVKEGRSPADDGYYVEMTRRLAKKFPEITVTTHDGRVAKFGSRGQRQKGGKTGGKVFAQKRAPTASARSSATVSKPSGKQGKVAITATERGMLEEMGVDLTDKKVAAEYLRNRQGR